MNFKYILGSIFTIPLLPFLYIQGKRIKNSIPDLPEAKGNSGFCPENHKESINLLTIGESTIAGVGVDTHEEGFSGTLAKELSQKLDVAIHWKVYAKSGYTASQVSNKIVDKIEEKSVDLIVIGLGGNDAFQLNRPGKWKASIRLLIEKIQMKFPGTPISFINMPPIKDFPSFTALAKQTIGNLGIILGEELERVIQEYDHVYYDPRSISANEMIVRHNVNASINDFFSDGVHPSKLAYQLWAKDVAEFITKTIPTIP